MNSPNLKTFGDVRAIAFYLPQFHPIPENDQAWGRGFTEWHNVTRAKAQFPGHYQPHLPADLGFYDLRLPEAQQAQADLAQEYGIHGFCYYHYWFSGRRLLERPLDEMLASGRSQFPFCLCWANENWTRTWSGNHRDVLMAQCYSPEDDLAHIRFLAPIFRDPRYIRVGGRPLFLLYRSRQLPDPARTGEIWREECRRLGVGEIFLARVESFPQEHGGPAEIGFDASVEFQPDWAHMPRLLRRKGLLDRVAPQLRLRDRAHHLHDIYDYPEMARRMMEKTPRPYRLIRCVTPSWDNTSRRQTGATILLRANPDDYGRWLAGLLEQEVRCNPVPQERLVFINAWNEWAEGNHLEPDQRWGRAYLEATKRC